jgi:hypothetical protein
MTEIEPRKTSSRMSYAEAVTLREYIEARLQSIIETERLSASALEKHLELTIAKYDADIRSLRESRAELSGKASQSAVNTAMLISVIGVIMSIVSLAMRFVGK